MLRRFAKNCAITSIDTVQSVHSICPFPLCDEVHSYTKGNPTRRDYMKIVKKLDRILPKYDTVAITLCLSMNYRVKPHEWQVMYQCLHQICACVEMVAANSKTG